MVRCGFWLIAGIHRPFTIADISFAVMTGAGARAAAVPIAAPGEASGAAAGRQTGAAVGPGTQRRQ